MSDHGPALLPCDLDRHGPSDGVTSFCIVNRPHCHSPRQQLRLASVGGVAPYTWSAGAANKGGNFRVILRNQWDQEVILDDAYNFVSTRRLDSAAQPAKR